MDRHQRHWRIAFVIVLIGNERGVIDKLAQSFNALIVVIDGGINEFLQVFETAFGFFSPFSPQRSIRNLFRRSRRAPRLTRGDADSAFSVVAISPRRVTILPEVSQRVDRARTELLRVLDDERDRFP